MSGSHEKLPWLFWVQLVLVAIVATLYFTLGPKSGGHGEDAAQAATEASMQALKPIGEVAVSGAVATTGDSERTGKEIVDKSCQSCHAHGIANAPKMDEGAKADWEARMAKGLDEVVAVAKKGKGAMPPMGTDPTLSDAELKNAVVYMLGKVGIEAGSSAEESAPAANKEPAPAASTEATSDSEKASDDESRTASADDVADKSVAFAAPSAPDAPEPPVTPSSSLAETASAGVVVAAETATEAKEVVTETVAEAKPSIDGAKLYSTTCFACHDTGAAGAPKVGDKPAWVDRIARGKEALYEASINGITSPTGVMPPKGGYMNLSDDEVKAIVDHMVSKSE